MTALETEMLGALKRALFMLESSSMPSFVNAGGTVDAVRSAIFAAAGELPGWAQGSAGMGNGLTERTS